MAETRRFGAPLLEAGQAQKHVTVNEALLRIDALSAGSVRSRSRDVPPPDTADGDLFVLPHGASGDWAGQDGSLAIRDNGAWIFAAAVPGRRIWVEDEGAEVVFDGLRWASLGGASRVGASTRLEVLTHDHDIAPGQTATTAAIIPDKAVVIGVTARVLETFTGPGLAGWGLGVPEAPGRYGSGHGLSAGTAVQGVTGQPLAYYGGTGLLLDAVGGSFAGGRVRLAVHCLLLDPPSWP